MHLVFNISEKNYRSCVIIARWYLWHPVHDFFILHLISIEMPAGSVTIVLIIICLLLAEQIDYYNLNAAAIVTRVHSM